MKGNVIRIRNLLKKKRFWLVKKIYVQNKVKIFLFFKFLKKRPWQDFMSDSFSLINPETKRNCSKTHCTMTFDLDSRWEESVLRESCFYLCLCEETTFFRSHVVLVPFSGGPPPTRYWNISSHDDLVSQAFPVLDLLRLPCLTVWL